jgi:hypothetical protein
MQMQDDAAYHGDRAEAERAAADKAADPGAIISHTQLAQLHDHKAAKAGAQPLPSACRAST